MCDDEEFSEETYTVTIRTCKETGEITGEYWFDEEGRPHRSNDLPADINYFRGEMTRCQFFQHGVEHREHGASLMFRSYETGVVYEEHHRKHGNEEHGKIASIQRDVDTGLEVSKSYIINGKRFYVIGPEVEYDTNQQEPSP